MGSDFVVAADFAGTKSVPASRLARVGARRAGAPGSLAAWLSEPSS